MSKLIQTSSFFYMLIVLMCFNSFYLMNTAAQDETASVSDNYTFETIDVPGVDF